MSQMTTTAAGIILPGGFDDDNTPIPCGVMDLQGRIHALVTYPKSLLRPFKQALQEDGAEMMWLMTDPKDEVTEDEQFECSRYLFRGGVFKQAFVADKPSPDEFFAEFEPNTLKDGYIFVPKDWRDGRHEQRYIVTEVKPDFYKHRADKGMLEEFAWSPFGDIETAIEMEDENTSRNPLLRRWQRP